MIAAVQRTRPRLLVGAVLAAGLITGLFAVASNGRGAAQEVDLGNEYISRARSAALNNEFGGELEVVWSGPDGRHRDRIAVKSAAGVLTLGDQVVVEGSARYARDAEGWAMLWGERLVPISPPPSEKWELTVKGGGLIAGRATREVSVVDPDSGRVRERRSFDAITGILLRREQYDLDGRRVRYASFVRITLSPSPVPGDAPTVPAHSDSHVPKILKRAREPYTTPIPVVVGNGFSFGGAYRKGGGTVQLFYSDGLFSASIFEQKGTLDRDALPGGGTDLEIAGTLVRRYEVPSGTVLMWDRDGLVYTTVSDAPFDEIETIVKSFGVDDEPGLTERVSDFLLGPFGW